MANNLVLQGVLNRLRGSVVVADAPELNVTAPFLGKAGIRHQVRDMVFEPETGKGAFLGAVVGSDGTEAPFLAWFELKDDRIYRYTIRPL